MNRYASHLNSTTFNFCGPSKALAKSLIQRRRHQLTFSVIREVNCFCLVLDLEETGCRLEKFCVVEIDTLWIFAFMVTPPAGAYRMEF